LGRGVFARARDYFVASEYTPPGVVRNSSIAYSLQIATFGQFFGWGAKGEFWPAMIFSAMFGAGLYLAIPAAAQQPSEQQVRPAIERLLETWDAAANRKDAAAVAGISKNLGASS
jgi:hypothetical protein